MLLIILVVGSISLVDFINTENANYSREMSENAVYYHNIPEGSIIVFDGFNSYIKSNVLENNYTAIYLENLKQPGKSEQLWNSNPSKYLDKVLNTNMMEYRNNNTDIFIVDSNNQYSKLKESYSIEKVYGSEELQIYKLKN